MKVLILAGGYGSRLSEETELKPKPMVEIGGRPILWHIMKIYSHFGFDEFIILCGYKGYLIKEYFANYFLYNADVTFELKDGSMNIHNNLSEHWKVTLINTGIDTLTGGRIKKVQAYVGNNKFLLTYGDGVANININKLIDFHESHDGFITMTSSQPEGRFGALDIVGNGRVSSFVEKPKGDGAWINAGYFVCEPEVFDYIPDEDNCSFEKEPLQKLAQDGKLFTYRHKDFWQPMDTLRDKIRLNKLWDSGNAKWKIWDK